MATPDTFARTKDALIRAELLRVGILLDRLATDLSAADELLTRAALAGICRALHEAAVGAESYQRKRYLRMLGTGG